MTEMNVNGSGNQPTQKAKDFVKQIASMEGNTNKIDTSKELNYLQRSIFEPASVFDSIASNDKINVPRPSSWCAADIKYLKELFKKAKKELDTKVAQEEEVQTASAKTETTGNSKPAGNVQQIENDIKARHDELKREKDALAKIATTEVSEKGGRTYAEAVSSIESLKVMIQSLYNENVWSLSDDALLKFIDDMIAAYKKSPEIVEQGAIEDLEAARKKLISCMESKKDLESKFPDLKNWEKEPINLVNSGVIIGPDGETVGTTRTEHKSDGTVETVYKDNDGRMTKKVVEYLDGSSITTNYDKDGKETYKKISNKEGDGTTQTFAKNGQVKLIINLIPNSRITITDEEGNPIEDLSTLKAILDEINASDSDRQLCELYFRFL